MGLNPDVEISLTNAPPFVSVRFLCAAFILGILVRVFTRWIRVPSQEPALLLVIGIVAGIIASKFRPHLDEYIDLVKTPPKALLSFFLPLMTFGTAFSMDAHAFRRSFWQIIILMSNGVALYVALVAFIIKNLPTNWEWEIAFMFAAATACTAPRPICSLFNDLGRSKRLVSLLQGEWLCGVATAIFIINMTNYIADGFKFGNTVTLHLLLRLIAGPLIGVLAGYSVLRFFPMMYNDIALEMLFSLVSAMLTFHITEQFIGSSGTLATMAMGIIVAGKRASMEPSDDLSLVQFWDMICFLIDTSVYIIAGMVCSLTEHTPDDPLHYVRLFLIFLACFGVRFAVVSLHMPLLSRLGYGLSWTELVILCWGSFRGTNSLLLALHVATLKRMKDIRSEIIVDMTCLVLVTLFANGVTLPLILHVMGQSGPSPMRRIDLQATHYDLAMVRKRKIGDMRADQSVPDAAWRLVHDIARVDESVVVPPPTASIPSLDCLKCDLDDDQDEINRRENLLRVLRLKKVGYWRQYSCGMLSTRALRLLLTAVSLAAEQCSPAELLAEIKPSWSSGKVFPLVRRWLMLLTSTLRPTMLPPPPRKRVRTLFFRAVMSAALARVMLAVMTLSLAPILWNILRNTCLKNWLYWTMQIVDVILYLFLFGEFVIKATGLGFRQLVSAPPNVVLVILLIVTTFSKTIDLLDMSDIMTLCHTRQSHFGYWMLFICLNVLRLNMLIRIIFECIPYFLHLVDHCMYKGVAFGFEVGSCFVTVQQEVARILPVLRISPDMVRELRLKEQEERLNVAQDLGILQTERPALASLVQTGQAIRYILNTQISCVRGLTERGLLDYSSRDRILTYIRRKKDVIHHSLKDLVPRSPTDILVHLPWVDGDKLVTSMLLEHVQSTTFQIGELVFPLHTPANGLYVVLSGVLRVRYEPSEDVLIALNEKGQLPVMDFFGALNFEDQLEDFVFPGKVYGEMAALTSRPHDAFAVAETAVQAFWLPQKLINSMMKMNSSTRQQLWLSIGSRIAQELLGQLPSFDKCGSKLGKARVEILSKEQSLLILDPAEDAVIVQGILHDVDGGISLKAPVVVPRAVRRLELLVHDESLDDAIEAVLLAVPLRGLDIEVLHTSNEATRNASARDGTAADTPDQLTT